MARTALILGEQTETVPGDGFSVLLLSNGVVIGTYPVEMMATEE